jgi:hypothetical protein
MPSMNLFRQPLGFSTYQVQYLYTEINFYFLFHFHNNTTDDHDDEKSYM